MSQGLIYIFTGEGKGKTSAALGMAVRAVAAGMKVGWIAWYKEASWDVSEYQLPKLLPHFDMFVMGKGFSFAKSTSSTIHNAGKVKVAPTNTGVVVDKHSEGEHQQAAVEGIEKLCELLATQAYDLIIADELCQAVGDELVPLQKALEAIALRGSTHLVLTGRHCPDEFITIADTVTSMDKVKHAYDSGTMAVKGLDF